MPRQDRLSLQTIEYNPTPFQALTFTPQAADANILARSFDTMAQRERDLAQQKSAVRQALGTVKEQLYASSDNNDFINRKVKEVEDAINAYTDLGDYAGAINIALDKGSKLTTDSELNARLAASKEYTSEIERQRKRVESNEIDQATFDWWKDTQATWNPTFDKDEAGNIVGLKDSNIAKKAPVKTLDVAELAKAAFSLINPSEKSGTTERKWTSKTGDTSGILSGGGGSRLSSSTKREVTEQDIRDNMDEILRLSGATEAQLMQAYEVYMHQTDVLNQELEDIKNREGVNSLNYKNKAYELQRHLNKITSNQSDATLELFIARTINEARYPKTLSYVMSSTENRTGNDSVNIAKAPDDGNSGNNGGNNGGNLVEKPAAGTIGGWNPYFPIGADNPGQKADRSAQGSGEAALGQF